MYRTNAAWKSTVAYYGPPRLRSPSHLRALIHWMGPNSDRTQESLRADGRADPRLPVDAPREPHNHSELKSVPRESHRSMSRIS